MQIKGVITKMCEPVTGESARGTWKKIGIVLQTEGEYPKDVYIEFWGDKADVVEVKLCEGMIVAVDFTLESREYNDRYYTQVRGYKYTIEGVVTSNASGYDKETAFFDCIYGGGTSPAKDDPYVPARKEEPAPAPAKDKVDDLPF